MNFVPPNQTSFNHDLKNNTLVHQEGVYEEVANHEDDKDENVRAEGAKEDDSTVGCFGISFRLPSRKGLLTRMSFRRKS